MRRAHDREPVAVLSERDGQVENGHLGRGCDRALIHELPGLAPVDPRLPGILADAGAGEVRSAQPEIVVNEQLHGRAYVRVVTAGPGAQGGHERASILHVLPAHRVPPIWRASTSYSSA